MLRMLVKCSKEDYAEKWLRVIFMNQLTDMEFKIMACIMEAGDCDSNKRKEIKEKLEISEASLNNYIAKLIKKKIFKKQGRIISLDPKFIHNDEREINFRFDIAE